jgi:hypothetical protein
LIRTQALLDIRHLAPPFPPVRSRELGLPSCSHAPYRPCPSSPHCLHLGRPISWLYSLARDLDYCSLISSSLVNSAIIRRLHPPHIFVWDLARGVLVML